MDTNQTALVVLVPEADPYVAAFRQRYDPSAADGMTAHITILAFFLPSGQIQPGVISDLEAVFRGHRRFSFSLRQTRTFPGVLYLAPEPAQPFIDLTRSVAEQFPECPPYGGAYREITPHLTIAATGDPQSVAGISREFQQAHPEGISVRGEVKAASLVVRRLGRWRTEAEFSLAE